MSVPPCQGPCFSPNNCVVVGRRAKIPLKKTVPSFFLLLFVVFVRREGWEATIALYLPHCTLGTNRHLIANSLAEEEEEEGRGGRGRRRRIESKEKE